MIAGSWMIIRQNLSIGLSKTAMQTSRLTSRDVMCFQVTSCGKIICKNICISTLSQLFFRAVQIDPPMIIALPEALSVIWRCRDRVFPGAFWFPAKFADLVDLGLTR